jgi:hypothetical protein
MQVFPSRGSARAHRSVAHININGRRRTWQGFVAVASVERTFLGGLGTGLVADGVVRRKRLARRCPQQFRLVVFA